MKVFLFLFTFPVLHIFVIVICQKLEQRLFFINKL